MMADTTVDGGREVAALVAAVDSLRASCRHVLSRSLSSSSPPTEGLLLPFPLSPASLASALELAIFERYGHATGDDYRDAIRRLASVLLRSRPVATALLAGSLTCGRVVRAAAAEALGALAEAVADEQELGAGLPLGPGGALVASSPAFLVLSFLGAPDLIRLGRVSRPFVGVSRSPALWRRLVRADFGGGVGGGSGGAASASGAGQTTASLPAAAQPTHWLDGATRGMGPAALTAHLYRQDQWERGWVHQQQQHQQQEAHPSASSAAGGAGAAAEGLPPPSAAGPPSSPTLSGVKRGREHDEAPTVSSPTSPPSTTAHPILPIRMPAERGSGGGGGGGTRQPARPSGGAAAPAAADDPIGHLRRPGESWQACYARLTAERGLAAIRDAAPKLLCEPCGSLSAAVRFHSHNMRHVKFTICTGCGRLEVLEDDQGDLPGMMLLGGS
jgi:hypothetical protein